MIGRYINELIEKEKAADRSALQQRDNQRLLFNQFN